MSQPKNQPKKKKPPRNLRPLPAPTTETRPPLELDREAFLEAANPNNPNPQETTMAGGPDTLTNPLAGETYVDPGIAKADAELRAEHQALFPEPTDNGAGPQGTAIVVAKAVDAACDMLFAQGLTEAERHELEGALLPVLVKRNVPNIPLAEELNLAMTVGGIIVPRVRAKIQAAREAEAAANEAPHDSPGGREEGLPQERVAPNDGFPSFGKRSTEAARLL